jgi:hypothetical protein
METTAASAVPDPAVFLHVRIVLSMVVSLSIARLLSGLAVFVQHPGRQKAYWVHLLWVASTLLLLVHFWWWEFRLAQLPVWRFELYAYVLFYAALNYLLCAVLFPNDLDEYDGWRDYFLSRRRWFFGLLALSFVVDLGDTWIKGSALLPKLGLEYPLRAGAYVLLCVAAAIIRSPLFHGVFAVGNLLYQASFIVRLYDVIE